MLITERSVLRMHDDPFHPLSWLGFVLAISVALLLASACGSRRHAVYAVVPKGQAHVSWQTVHAGAAAAAREASVEAAWNGPAVESDFGPISIVDDFINRHVDGILIAPTQIRHQKYLK